MLKRKNQLFALMVPFVSFSLLAQQASDSEQNWVDSNHEAASSYLQVAADEMNSWFGTPKASEPAEAELRIMLDNRWNKYDGYSIKPRIRGKLKLPTLQERLNIVFGDDTIDDDLQDAADITSTTTGNRNTDNSFDSQQSRQDNASVGLQWEVPRDDDNVKTRVTLGLRSRGDIYVKAKSSKDWYHGNDFKSHAELIYRYGINSKHYARANYEFSLHPEKGVITADQVRIDYRNNDDEEGWSWGNTLYRKHPTGDDTWFNYGVYVGGDIAHGGEFSINTYGPFAGFRTNIYRSWLFLQPEITYYNDKDEDRTHHFGAMVRLEAQF